MTCSSMAKTNKKQHDESLEAVLKRLLKAGVTLNLDKCVIKYRVAIMAHQTLSLEKYRKLFSVTVNY